MVPYSIASRENIEWKGIDSHSANAVINDSGYSVSAVFTFNDEGEITTVTTEDRHRKINGKKERLPWTAYYKNYQELNGVKIPTEVEAGWNLQKGFFQYAKLKVIVIRYNEQ